VNLTKKNRQRRVATPPTPFEQARDELFQQIMRCEVIGASPEHQVDWFNETMAYFGQRYPELKPADVSDLRKLGERFVQPPKAAIVADDAIAPDVEAMPSDVVDVPELHDADRTNTAEQDVDAAVEEGETVPA
jgi:hypothetical protein